MDKIKLTISEISTTSSDTGSTMKTCEGTVTMTLPANEYAQLSDAYRKNFNRNLDKQMESLSLDNNANAFSKRISYTAQATDDQKNVFVKATSNNPISVGAAALTSLSIINPIVEQQKSSRLRMPSEVKLKRNNKHNSGRSNRINMRRSSRFSKPFNNNPTSSLSNKKLTTLISPEWLLRMLTLI
ncbi:hypothetical protein LNO36_29795 [Klebsiella variicola subsp. variicola]|nr:hypothetical protein [Klebsiella variicola subsp. variicola]